MDIKVKTGTGEWIDIEMQVSETPEYRKRSLFYDVGSKGSLSNSAATNNVCWSTQTLLVAAERKTIAF